MNFLTQTGNFLLDLTPALKFATIAAAAYLLGSVNTAIIVSKLTLKKDIRDYGSGNAGLTNSIRSMGIKKGLVVLAGDVAKCAAAILFGQLVYSGDMNFIGGAPGRLWAGLFVFIGHILPLYFGFRGGKGLLTFGVTVLMFDWRIGLIGLGVFFVIVLTTRYVSLGGIIASATIPVMVFLFSFTSISEMRLPLRYTFVAFTITCLVTFMHRQNIVRLIKGTESKFSFRSKPLMEDAEKTE